jgi:hypothetical protein
MTERIAETIDLCFASESVSVVVGYFDIDRMVCRRPERDGVNKV